MAAQSNQQTSWFHRLWEVQLTVWHQVIQVLEHIWGLLILVLLALIVLGYIFDWPWTGFHMKTLWDWLQLLIFPLVLAVLTVWFSTQNSKVEGLKGQNVGLLERIAELHVKGYLTDKEFVDKKTELLRRI